MFYALQVADTSGNTIVSFRFRRGETIEAYDFLCTIGHLKNYTTNTPPASITVQNNFILLTGYAKPGAAHNTFLVSSTPFFVSKAKLGTKHL